MTLNCHAALALIDLYAAGELPPEEREATRAHISDCPRCQGQLDEARSLLGLLDVHYARPGGLARLRQAVRREAGAGPRLLRFAQRLAPLAALLLVAAGLALLLPTRTAPPASGPLAADLAFVPEKAAPSRNGPKIARGGVKGLAVMNAELEAVQGAKKAKSPLPIALNVTLHNPGAAPLVVELGGAGFALRMDLRGPRVEREPAPPGTPPPVPGPRRVTLRPGGRHVLELTQLAEQHGRDVSLVFPAAAGDYRLSAEVRARTWPSGTRGPARQRSWRAGPVTLSLKPDGR